MSRPFHISTVFPALLLVVIFSAVCEAAEKSTPVSPVERITWEDCLREAARNHPDLLSVKEGTIQQEADKAVTAGGEYPQVSADFSAASSQSRNSGAGKTFDYGVSATQLIFDGFKTANNVKAATEDVVAAQENFKFTSATVRFRLREAFVNLLKAQALFDSSREIFKIRDDNLQLIALRYQSGTEHKGSYLDAQANLSQAKYEVNQAQRNLEAAQWQLSKELGRKSLSPLIARDSFEVSNAVQEKPDLEKLATENPSLRKIAAQRRSAEFSVKASEADFFPEISLSGGMSNSDQQWTPSNPGTTAGISVSVPLFEGGSRLAKVRKARSVLRQLQEEERSAQDGILLTLEQTWTDLQDTVENVDVQKEFLLASEERAKIAEQQYSVGLISYDNWTIIEDDLVKNKTSYVNARAEALLAEARWIQAKGETLEYEIK